MKARTNEFKQQIASLYETKNTITYTISGTSYTLTDEELYSIEPHYETDLLKSVMKALDIQSSVSIPNGTIINYQFGIKVRENSLDNYDYISYGNYVVYSSEKQEDEDTYLIKCYDKMLYSMVDYETPKVSGVAITYPITVRNYISAICSHLGLTFKNASDTFTNYDKEIPKELYLDEDNKSLGYKFRDVLDELAQVTASNIVINESDDKLEIRYITETNDTINEEYFDETNVNFGELYGPVNTIILSRSEDSDVFAVSYPTDLADDLKKAIKIKDNQIMSGDNRGLFANEILDKLKGLSFTTCDYSSKGILYYNVCDRYTASIFGNTYSCVMLNDDVSIEDGISENVHTNIPEEATTDYSKATNDVKQDRKTKLIVDKQTGEIRAEVESITETISDDNGILDRLSSAESTLNSQGAKLDIVSTNIDPKTGDVLALKRQNYEFGINGIIIEDQDGYKSVRDTKGDFYYDNDECLGKYTKDGAVIKDLAIFGALHYGVDDDVDVYEYNKEQAMFIQMKYENNGEECVGHFFNGSN